MRILGSERYRAILLKAHNRVGADEQREAAIAVCQMYRIAASHGLVSAYRKCRDLAERYASIQLQRRVELVDGIHHMP